LEADVSMSWQHRCPSASPVTPHLRTLNELHDSLFAPQFRALETYGAAAPPPPTPAEVMAAAEATLAWHTMKEAERAAELSARRNSNAAPALIDDVARALAYHRNERERIAADLAAVTALAAPLQAAE
jgi:hypothetical protein